MKAIVFTVAVGGFALLAGCATTHRADPGVMGSENKIESDDHEIAVTLDQVPDAVRATILEYTDAASITELVLDNESGASVYDVETGNSEFSVSPSGEYLGAEDDDGDDDGDDEDGEHDD